MYTAYGWPCGWLGIDFVDMAVNISDKGRLDAPYAPWLDTDHCMSSYLVSLRTYVRSQQQQSCHMHGALGNRGTVTTCTYYVQSISRPHGHKKTLCMYIEYIIVYACNIRKY